MLSASIDDQHSQTNLPSLLLLHTSRVSVTIFSRVLQDTFYRDTDVWYS